MQVTMTVNGETVTREIEGRMLLVHFLRDELRLTGTHWGCDTSNCGTCVAWMDGEPVKTCTVLAAMAGGREVRTVEGLEQDGVLDPVQEGFMRCHGLQCGFCTPGMLMTARALLDRDPDPSEDTIREAISGQICRCTGYTTIVRSVQWAAEHEKAHRTRTPRPSGASHDHLDQGLDDGVAATPEDLEHADNDQHPVGHGRMLRKEDPRFIRGMGKYVDDIQLPGMLHLAILRSPVAHATIVSIDVTAAQAHPKVKAVITGADLAAQGLAWMPTLSNDVQAVLATDKVRFQGQEVAFVVAEDRYAARDALELIDVEYDILPPVIDVRRALAPDAPVIRTTSTARRTTTASTGRPATRTPPRRSSRTPTSWSPRTSSTRACTPRRWRPAAASPTTSGSAASSRSGRPARLRTPTAPSTRWCRGCPSTRSGSSRPTSAAASATRCRSTPATSARSSPRW